MGTAENKLGDVVGVEAIRDKLFNVRDPGLQTVLAEHQANTPNDLNASLQSLVEHAEKHADEQDKIKKSANSPVGAGGKSRGKGKNADLVCDYCGRQGHTKPFCFKKKREGRAKNRASQNNGADGRQGGGPGQNWRRKNRNSPNAGKFPECPYCHRHNHLPDDCYWRPGGPGPPWGASSAQRVPSVAPTVVVPPPGLISLTSQPSALNIRPIQNQAAASSAPPSSQSLPRSASSGGYSNSSKWPVHGVHGKKMARATWFDLCVPIGWLLSIVLSFGCWIVGTGARKHFYPEKMARYLGMKLSWTSECSDEFIETGNGPTPILSSSSVYIPGIGEIDIRILKGTVPLLSVGLLVKNLFRFIWEEYYFPYLVSPEGRVVHCIVIEIVPVLDASVLAPGEFTALNKISPIWSCVPGFDGARDALLQQYMGNREFFEALEDPEVQECFREAFPRHGFDEHGNGFHTLEISIADGMVRDIVSDVAMSSSLNTKVLGNSVDTVIRKPEKLVIDKTRAVVEEVFDETRVSGLKQDNVLHIVDESTPKKSEVVIELVTPEEAAEKEKERKSRIKQIIEHNKTHMPADPDSCEICRKGKMKRRPARLLKGTNKIKAKEYAERINIDLVGKVEEATNGSIYGLVGYGEFAESGCLEGLRSKHPPEALKGFKELYAGDVKPGKTRVSSDNGGEFLAEFRVSCR